MKLEKNTPRQKDSSYNSNRGDERILPGEFVSIRFRHRKEGAIL
jgi:hypothetical protein